MQLVRAMSLLAIVAMMASCGANLPQTASLTSDASAAGAAYPSTGPQKAEAIPSPYSDPVATATGGREVIENPTIADVMAPSPLPEMSWGSADA